MATISTDNYTIGGIDIYFDPTENHASLTATNAAEGVGGVFRTTARSLGNIVSAEFNPDITYIEHYVSVRGSRKLDKEMAMTKTLTIPFVFDEINEANMRRFFLASDLGSNQLAILEEPLVTGSASIRFRTDVGTSMTYSIPSCTIRPDGAMAMNIEDWWNGPMVVTVYEYTTATAPFDDAPYGILDMS